MKIDYDASDTIHEILENLAGTGLFGETVAEVVDRLVSEKLREVMDEDWFLSDWLPEDWATDEDDEDEDDESED